MATSTKTKNRPTPKRELRKRITELKAKRKSILASVKELPIIEIRLKVLKKMVER